jgi:hypothetical protein
MHADCVIAWSEPVADRWGDEALRHYVAYADNYGTAIGTVTECETADGAAAYAHTIARGLEVVTDELIWD